MEHFSNIKNMMNNNEDSHKRGKEEQEYNMTIKKSTIVDNVEILSFALMMHGYAGFYLFLSSQNVISMCIYQLFAYIICRSMFQYNFFSFVFHPFFRSHSYDIVLPQTLYTLFNYYVLSTNYNTYLLVFMNVILYSFSNQYFDNIEHKGSREVRTFINIITYIVKSLYIKMILYFFTKNSLI